MKRSVFNNLTPKGNIMVTRTKIKASVKPLITETPFVETLRPEAVTEDDLVAQCSAYLKGLLIDMPSWKRMLCAAVLSGVTGYGVGYLGGTLVAYLVVGAMVLGVSSFIAQILFVLGLLVAFYAAYRASAFAYVKVIDKTVDAKFAQAKGWVTGLFTSTPKAA